MRTVLFPLWKKSAFSEKEQPAGADCRSSLLIAINKDRSVCRLRGTRDQSLLGKLTPRDER